MKQSRARLLVVVFVACAILRVQLYCAATVWLPPAQRGLATARYAVPKEDEAPITGNSVPRRGGARGAVVSRLKSTLLRVRRRWGLGLVRLVVRLVMKIELMAAQESEDVEGLLTDTVDAARQGILDFTGKNDYRFGDITKSAVSKFSSSLESKLLDYTGKDKYTFGDITKTTVSKFTGKDKYEFGDITKTAVSKVTGKSEYQFGDITRTIISKITGDDKGDDAKK